MSEEIDFLEADEEIASEENILAPLDVYLYFEMIEEIRNENKLFRAKDIRELCEPFGIKWDRIRESLLRLSNKKVLSPSSISDSPENVIIEIETVNSAFSRMGIHQPLRSMSQEELKKLGDTKILEAKQGIDFVKKRRTFFEEIETKIGEIEKIKEDLKKSQIDILRNMIGIFAIFVSIFSFILIGSSSALSIQPRGIFDLSIIIAVVTVPILILLVVVYLLFIRQK